MALLKPLNDKECLTRLHRRVKELIRRPGVRRYAAQFRSLNEFIRHVRTLEQRDDLGDADDGPRLPCEVSQRSRFAPSDPNCWERTLLYLAVAEILAEKHRRTSASLLLDGGWHTFPVEYRNGHPYIVVLDPYSPPRNAMLATAYQSRNLNPLARPTMPSWFLSMTRNACLDDSESLYRFNNALAALRNAVLTGESIDHVEDLEDLEYVLDLAERDAGLWGERGQRAFDEVSHGIRNFSLRLNSSLISKALKKLTKATEAMAPQAIKAALVSHFGPAAAIVLEGIDVAVTNDEEEDDDDDDDNDEIGTLKLSLERGEPTIQHGRVSPSTLMRRMTLGFR